MFSWCVQSEINFEKVTIIITIVIFQRSASKEEEMALLQHAEFKEAFDEFDKVDTFAQIY